MRSQYLGIFLIRTAHTARIYGIFIYFTGVAEYGSHHILDYGSCGLRSVAVSSSKSSIAHGLDVGDVRLEGRAAHLDGVGPANSGRGVRIVARGSGGLVNHKRDRADVEPVEMCDDNTSAPTRRSDSSLLH